MKTLPITLTPVKKDGTSWLVGIRRFAIVRAGDTRMPTQTHVTPDVDIGTNAAVDFERLYQVVLYNDDVNSMEHVVKCLMQIFKHPESLAVKIMLEAHQKGKAIAEVESRTPAELHKDQLISYGLTATIEKIPY
jgi:ATP-dependent Clp protease adaptor protein ClpS